MGCLSDDDALAYAQGGLTGAAGAGIETHLAGCPSCTRVVAEALKYFAEERGGPVAPVTLRQEAQPPAMLTAGERVSRFEIAGVLGVGASGVVYRARDTTLERQVALKLLRPDITDEAIAARWRQRFLFEAQAMARLSHPNVVMVFEAGLFAGQAFIAMELVEGESLGRWLQSSPRDWRQVAAVFLQLSRGLAAAHTAGLVHGDFKPDNVLVSPDGRARITDFGLARRLGPARAVVARAKVAGTPLYMAPETLGGQAVDARSDQFSFCVALYRAVYGHHPFGDPTSGTSPVPLAALTQRELRKPSAGHAVPGDIHAVLARGLRSAAGERFASMEALCAALERAIRRAALRLLGRRVGTAAIGAAVMALFAAGAWSAATGPRCGNARTEANEACDDGNDRNDDACTSSCQFAGCGDGHLRARLESCDDGNRLDGDGCTAGCVACRPGPGEARLEAAGTCYLRPAAGAGLACRSRGMEPVATEAGENPALTAWLAAIGAEVGAVCADRPWIARPGTALAYKLLHEPVNWQEAHQRCRDIGATLVAPEDAAENAFVAGQASIPFWMGADDRLREGEFRWQGGAPVAFEGFARGEPDDPDGANDCVAFDLDRRWHDRPCTALSGYMCETR